jgi:hypothetical protein
MLGCDFIATGHYAMLKQENGRYFISKGLDKSKDQSYALWGVSQESLARTILPLSHLTKKEIYEMAAQRGFVDLVNKSESYEICFVPDNDYRGFLRHRVPGLSEKVAGGEFVNEQGDVSDTPQVGKIERYLLNLDGNPNRFAFYSRFWATCQGDSGSPIVIESFGTPIIIGVLNAASTNRYSGRINCASSQVFSGLYEGTATLLSAYSDLIQVALAEIARVDLEIENEMRRVTDDAIADKILPSLESTLKGNYVIMDIWLAGRSDLGFIVQTKTKSGKWKSVGNFSEWHFEAYQAQYVDVKIKIAKDVKFLRIKEIETNFYSEIVTVR